MTTVEQPMGLQAEGLTKRFTGSGTDVVALAGIDLDVPQGSFTSVIGPSGCGKSTLLRIFADLVEPTSGAATVNGKSPQKAREDREFGVVFQSPNLLPWRTVLKNVTLPLQVMGVPRADRAKTATDMLELVGLPGFERHHPWQLSGGMQQRVAIARALSMQPNILFMDEPFGALDEITRDRLNLELIHIWARTSATVMFITHSLTEAVFLSTRVAVMSARPGRITEVIDIDLPAERTAETRDDPRFYELVIEVRKALSAAADLEGTTEAEVEVDA